MNVPFEYQGQPHILTTEHSVSSYGIPVVLREGEVTDDYRISSADASQGRRFWRVHTWDGVLVIETEAKRWDAGE